MTTKFKPIGNPVAVTCIECRKPDATVCVDVSGECVGRFQCCDCEAIFYPADVREFLAATANWERVLSWLDAFPRA